MQKSMPAEISAAYEQIAPDARPVLLDIRALLYETVKDHAQIGPVQEVLKWGQPSYLSQKARIGSTLRLGTSKDDGRPTLYINCQSDLMEQIREIYPSQFHYAGARAVSLLGDLAEVREAVSHIILMVLTYHIRKARG
ncbi:MAG: hypothetical protein ACJA06_001998 [Halocynthiibacter sp.]|jgi:hypothetical protein